MKPVLRNTLFLDACHRRKTTHTPVWFMRQAGRYLPGYRKVREQHDVFTICKTFRSCSFSDISAIDCTVAFGALIMDGGKVFFVVFDTGALAFTKKLLKKRKKYVVRVLIDK